MCWFPGAEFVLPSATANPISEFLGAPLGRRSCVLWWAQDLCRLRRPQTLLLNNRHLAASRPTTAPSSRSEDGCWSRLIVGRGVGPAAKPAQRQSGMGGDGGRTVAAERGQYRPLANQVDIRFPRQPFDLSGLHPSAPRFFVFLFPGGRTRVAFGNGKFCF